MVPLKRPALAAGPASLALLGLLGSGGCGLLMEQCSPAVETGAGRDRAGGALEAGEPTDAALAADSAALPDRQTATDAGPGDRQPPADGGALVDSALAEDRLAAVDGAGAADSASPPDTGGPGDCGCLADIAVPPTDAGQPDGAAGDAAGPGPDGAQVDASAADGAAPPPRCGTVSAIQDDFDDNMAGAQWLTTLGPGMSLSEAGGVLQLELAPNQPGHSYSAYYSRLACALRENSLRVLLTHPVDVNEGEPQAYLDFLLDNDNEIYIMQAGGLLSGAVELDGISNPVYDLFQPVGPIWLQIREQAGTVYLEHSRDALSWSLLGAFDTPPWADLGYVVVGAGTWQELAAPGVAHFDELNTNRPLGAWCPASSFTDDLSGDGLAPMWETHGTSGCKVDLTYGDVRLSTNNVPNFSCSLATRAAFSLEEDQVLVMVRLHMADPRIVTGLVLVGYGGDLVKLGFKGDQIMRELPMYGISLSSTAPVGVSWLKLSESGGTLTYSISSNGSDWDELGDIGGVIGLDAVRVELRVEAEPDVPLDDLSGILSNTVFDDYNLPPP